MKTESKKVSFSVPIRRTRWTSFWIGAAAVVFALLLAFAFSGLLLLLVNIDGVVIIILFGFILFGLFFLSYPLQRRYARSLDLRRPCVSLAGGILTVPLAEDTVLHFKLDEPHELIYGWWEFVMVSTGPTSRTRAVWTHATLSQTGQQLYFIAEDSIREAQSAGWPKTPDSSTPTMPRVRLWASDLVALVKAVRASSHHLYA
ncbi:MAG: hypothetical protein WCD76_01200 [Pyrinomonadaceae bacterium]